MENKENEAFCYTYSAKEQEEIKNIRKKYAATEASEDKMERLRRLDKSVTDKATTKSLIVGIIGALIMGTGMSLVMTDLGEIFGAYQNAALYIGILVGIVGIVLVGYAYPVYNRVLKKERERIAPEILQLTEELIK